MMSSPSGSASDSSGASIIPPHPPGWYTTPGYGWKPLTTPEVEDMLRDTVPTSLDIRPRDVVPTREDRAARYEETREEYQEVGEEDDEDESSPPRPAVPAARRHEIQVSERERRARLRAQRHEEVWEQAPALTPSPGARRRTTRSQRVTYAEPSPVDGSSSASGSLFVSPASATFSSSPTAPTRGTKRKRAAAAKDYEDEDEEMADASSRSRSITPAPPIKKRGKRVTTLADSDDEMSERAKSRSLSRSATPAPPPVKRRKVEGKRKVVLEDSDDEME